MAWIAHPYARVLLLTPLGLLALHTCGLAYFYPNIPTTVYRHGRANGLNPTLISWSLATATALVLSLCIGIPLRLNSYASLGKNFTFDLQEPDRLMTDGIYSLLQHPSYTGLLALALSEAMLLLRIDGALSCWIPPQHYRRVRQLWRLMIPLWLPAVTSFIWIRVNQEEAMMLATFGAEWESWHAKTARLIPWVF